MTRPPILVTLPVFARRERAGRYGSPAQLLPDSDSRNESEGAKYDHISGGFRG